VASTDPTTLSVREIRRRLREVYDASYHLKTNLPPESAYNAVLTLRDIGRHVKELPQWLRNKSQEAPPNECERACPSVNECRNVPPCRKIEPYLQRRLSEFFHGWDRGTLVKALYQGQWQIVPRYDAALAKVDAAPRPAAHPWHFDIGPEGPRLKP
jgi:hypothetical protein